MHLWFWFFLAAVSVGVLAQTDIPGYTWFAVFAAPVIGFIIDYILGRYFGAKHFEDGQVVLEAEVNGLKRDYLLLMIYSLERFHIGSTEAYKEFDDNLSSFNLYETDKLDPTHIIPRQIQVIYISRFDRLCKITGYDDSRFEIYDKVKIIAYRRHLLARLTFNKAKRYFYEIQLIRTPMAPP